MNLRIKFIHICFYNIYFNLFKAKNKMGNMCSCSNGSDEGYRMCRKVSVGKKQSIKTATDASQSKIILQSLKDKYKSSLSNFDQLTEFQIICQLGRGGQADVFEVKLLPSERVTRETSISADKTYALKRILKNSHVNKRHSLDLGKNIIMSNRCPFIMDGIVSYEDDDYMYHIMQKASGGDMATFLAPNTLKAKLFRELGQQGIKNVAAGVILGLEYLHKKNIIYCDLKLENVLIGSDGYPLLVDFQMAVHGRQVSSCGYRGTMSYVAPQVFLEEKVDRAMDIWAFGIFLYALTYGKAPFSIDEVACQNFSHQCKKKQNRFCHSSKEVSKELSCLINSILKINPKERLGYWSLGQIKGHSFFLGFDWEKYGKKEIQSPLLKIIQELEIEKEEQRDSFQQEIKSNCVMKKKRKQSAETECDELDGERECDST